MMKKLLKNQRGLTLIELLAVIVILGIISAIAVPSIGNIIDNTKKKAKVSEAIQIINAAKIAKSENPSANTFVPGTADNGDISLDTYLDRVKDEVFIVKSTGTGYTIAGHESATVIKSTYSATKAVTEQELVDYTDTEE